MAVTLEEWQERLERHFESLALVRRETGCFLFVLEHGLTHVELEELSECLRSFGKFLDSHWLLWVIYATERGYSYSGDEYWQSFEEQTPGWEFSDRYKMVPWFRKFQNKYAGVEPTGAWAKHFSIICWPITHAILPRDLQRQLARILYESRHLLSTQLLESPLKLGEFIAERSWNATSRFMNLVQEPQLVGQIATALLMRGELETNKLINPATLKRIGDDLDKERQAREWLKSARQFVKEHPQVHGLGLIEGVVPNNIGERVAGQQEAAELGIEPRLILRPIDVMGDLWEVLLEIPDLSHLPLRFPYVREILTNSRCRVKGSVEGPLARGRCLYGAQRVMLAQWPKMGEVLLQFERTDPQLEYLLRTECLLRSGPTWLFRIATDGLAYECRSLRVRPGERYIIINVIGPIKSDHVCPINVKCDGVYGAVVKLPCALTEEWENALLDLGLGQAKTIEVWPAGLTAVSWDGEGHGEWLASERPCFAICADHSISSICITMSNDDANSIELSPIISGVPVFVELSQLAVGLHTVNISARNIETKEMELLGTLKVIMRIREAQQWAPCLNSRGPVVVQIDPLRPTLEQLWGGYLDIEIKGPLGRKIRCAVSFFERNGEEATVFKKLQPLVLPVSPDIWRTHFDKFFRRTREATNAYDTTRICELVFNAEELGSFTIRCEREFVPLRWALRSNGHEYIAQLLDDSGSSMRPVIIRMSYENPLIEEELVIDDEYLVPPEGGLYAARMNGNTASIIVPPTVRELRDLRCKPTITGSERTIESVHTALELAHVWGVARLSGNLISETRHHEVLKAINHRIVKLLCGDHWIQTEETEGKGYNWLDNLQRVISGRREEAGMGSALHSNYINLIQKTQEERIEYLECLASKNLVMRVGVKEVEDSVWLSELSLRLVSNPTKVVEWAGQRLDGGLKCLMEELPTLVRSSRFLVLAIDRFLQSENVPGELYAGWRWK